MLFVCVLLSLWGPKDNHDEPKRWKNGVKWAQFFRENAWVRANWGGQGQKWRRISSWVLRKAVPITAKRGPEVAEISHARIAQGLPNCSVTVDLPCVQIPVFGTKRESLFSDRQAGGFGDSLP